LVLRYVVKEFNFFSPVEIYVGAAPVLTNCSLLCSGVFFFLTILVPGLLVLGNKSETKRDDREEGARNSTR
jgi:hypothetical protein